MDGEVESAANGQLLRMGTENVLGFIIVGVATRIRSLINAGASYLPLIRAGRGLG
jgi:hypothetical protein